MSVPRTIEHNEQINLVVAPVFICQSNFWVMRISSVLFSICPKSHHVYGCNFSLRKNFRIIIFLLESSILCEQHFLIFCADYFWIEKRNSKNGKCEKLWRCWRVAFSARITLKIVCTKKWKLFCLQSVGLSSKKSHKKIHSQSKVTAVGRDAVLGKVLQKETPEIWMTQKFHWQMKLVQTWFVCLLCSIVRSTLIFEPTPSPKIAVLGIMLLRLK